MPLISTIFSTEFAYSVLRVATPLIFAALAALVANQAGIMHIAFEGVMLWAALLGVLGSAYTQSVLAGLLCGVAGGVLISLLIGYFVMNLKANLILASIAINTFATGGTVFVLYLVCNDKGISSSLKSLVVPKLAIPFLEDIPVAGAIVSGHNALTYVAFLCVALVYLLLYKTNLGLDIRAVGENPNAAASVGISVRRTKFIALIFSGILAALGGCFMSMGYLSWFTRGMVAGRGFIGIAAQNLGGSAPVPTLLAALVFGVADALSNTLQSLRIPAEFVQMIPYITTLLGLALYANSKQKKGSSPKRKPWKRIKNAKNKER